MYANPIKRKLTISKVIALVSLALFTLFAANSAFAGWWHKTPEEHAAKMASKITDELDLDKKQEALLKTSVSEVMAKFKELKPKKEGLRSLIREQIQSGKIDKVQVKQTMEQHKQAMSEVMDFGLDKADAFLQSLNPEQRGKLLELADEMKGHGGGHCRGWM